MPTTHHQRQRWIVAALLTAFALAARSHGDAGAPPIDAPIRDLPKHIRALTEFGERAEWSPDGRRIAFMSKSWGDALEYNLDTGRIRNLTARFQHEGFLRVHYLSNGDYLLIGSEHSANHARSRDAEQEFWVLRASDLYHPVRLGQRVSEGAAISTRTPRISWCNTHGQYPDRIPAGQSELYVADISYDGGQPHLANVRKVITGQPPCTMESQDFRHNDREVTYTCYMPNRRAQVMGVELDTGKITNYTQVSDEYQECEGIFPDGDYTCVEGDRQNHKGPSFVDIWRLRLDGTGKDYVRLTHFSDYPGYKASNPTISPDGHWMAFQLARSDEPAGVGHGILVYDLRRGPKK
jgi:dipeptidyl aminopeptidase/acylaminoacyl peptidase